ncbi:MAG: TonB-dependent receptor [bacterium]
MRFLVVGTAFLVHIVAAPPELLFAQGVAGAAVHGSVVTGMGGPISGAQVTLSNPGTGTVRVAVAGARGEFLFDAVPVGTGYRLEARAIGFSPARVDSISLHLGDRLSQSIVLGAVRAQLLSAMVVSDSNLRDPGAGGPAYSIPGGAVRSLPLLNRDFVGLFAMAPQAVGSGAPSVSGQHSRFNAIQVDGGTANDFFGVNVTPGAGSGAKAISLESLDEIRVLVAPFDVRQGGFSGGLINAVTRSGTNQFHGSLFSLYSGTKLVGADTSGTAIQPFSVYQYGASLGGPIIRDRLRFFFVVDRQSRETPFNGPSTADPATGINEATVQRASQIFREKYGFDAGTSASPTLNQPNESYFLKLSLQPARNHSIDVSYNDVRGTNDVLNRINRTRPDRDGWQLSNSGDASTAKNRVLRIKATSAWSNFTNELIAGTGTVKDGTASTLRVPLFLVQADKVNTYLAGGSVKQAQGTETDQNFTEFTDNLSWSVGEHLFTLGTQNQFLHFRDNLFFGSWGTFTFGSVDSLSRGLPLRYEVALPIRPGGPLSDYTSTQVATYVQDRWSASPRLTLTAGVRVDIPFIQPPTRNDALAADDILGRIDTKNFPTGNAVVSPRLGVAYDLAEGRDHGTMLRGGIGAFAGRPPYVWLTNAFANTGKEQALLVCNPANGVPAPVTDITALPSKCTNASAPSSAVPTIDYFARNFRFQQAVKFDAGFDHDFGNDLSLSLDLIHTRTVNTMFVSDVNLVDRGTNAEGRVMYGTFTGAAATASRLDPAYGPVFRFENRTGDRSTALSADLSKHFASGATLQIGYDWSSTYDLISLAGNTGPLIFQNNPIDGSVASRTLRRSTRDIPHSFVATTTIPTPLGTMVSLFIRARSGTPYAYVSTNDANADGTIANDLAYIPRDANDITLTNPTAYGALDDFIKAQPCMDSQRGQVMTRNSCRNPAVQSIDARIGKTVRLGGAKNVEITADVFNVPNLLNHGWGLTRQTTPLQPALGEAVGLLSVAGWDAVNNRPRYTVLTVNGQTSLPARGGIVVDAARWRMQLGARYTF